MIDQRSGRRPGARDASTALSIHIVDDDALVRSGLARLMRSAGHSPLTFEDGESLLAHLHQSPPDCVLLDITLSGMTGIKLQEQLRALVANVPVIAVSASDDEETVRLARQLGVRFFFHKPVDGLALLDAIKWVTGGSGAR
jgi:FixJ family two-component response regulator